MSKNVVFDFDGVIHSYTSGWLGVTIIPDPPVNGIGLAIESIRREGYNVIVQSTRCSTPEGVRAVKDYLDKYNITVDDITSDKPPAVAYIDDRAICFDGHPETLLKKVKQFKPWNNTHKFQECWVYGKRCLFCIDRIDRDEYPALNRYELMYDDNDEPTSMQTDVLVNFYGSILSPTILIDRSNRNYYASNGNLGVNFNKGELEISNNMITMEEFMGGR
jgi:hypothetical protein